MIHQDGASGWGGRCGKIKGFDDSSVREERP